ncbi:hypothetical protein [Streptomyces sp. NBC_00140]|uniref:hypothetical protein n=1 Tax=Streptomyces sp. NBC_00140 TaxID=2975664 RepID=UPI002258CE03|nr:hypothetical protein [Streptomyces sp. NBC_00140]MCX5336945.1 hypothetical protein [Streptomyces sp. NBC_00140]MCX5338428.1 hypothetical protein [Streptomyces sp. NBC_00140]
MSVTINAHQLKLLLDQTADHMGGEHVEMLHGIRLDVDSQYVYAVATDRYTLAAARYRLADSDQNQEPWARLIPGDIVPALREWINTMKGAEYITISAADDRLVFDGPRHDLTVAVSTSLEFPDWRGLLRGIAAQTVDGEPFPALNTDFLPRWAAIKQSLRTRVTADRKAVLFFGQDFIGAQMPSSGGGIGPAKNQTFDAAHSLWLWTLAAGATDVDMASLPKPEPSNWEATKSVEETAANLLRGVLDSTSNAFNVDSFDGDHDAWHAHIRSGVADWMAWRYLDALHQVDPRAAQAVVADTAEQLDSGELGEWAYDMAEQSGFNPKQWHDDYEARLAKQMAEEPRKWAVRLALALTDAKHAGINFRVDDNEFVAFDAEAGEWKAVKPQPAEEPAAETAA